MPDTYRQDEVQEILHLAIARQTRSSNELTRHQMLEIAEDLGLSESEIMRAEQEWRSLQGDTQERQAFLRYRRLQFHQHAVKYLITNGFLVLIDFLTFGDGDFTLSWSLYIALFWGMFLTLNGWSVMQTEGEAFERRYRSWRRRRWLHNSMGKVFGQWFNKAL